MKDLIDQWVNNTEVYENAKVYGNAKVYENIKSQSKGTKNMKFTAKEALELAQSKNLNFRVQKGIDTLLDRVKQAAEKGQYYIETRDYEFGSGNCYCSEKDYPEICKQVLQELRSLGFKCTVYADEKQFVDMWLNISWKDD